MREDARKRLDQELRARKLKWIGSAGVAVAAIAGMLYFQNLDISVVKTNRIEGTVVYVGPLHGKYAAAVAEANLQVDVKLHDSRVAHLMRPRDDSPPKVGDRVTIADHIHGSGRHTFGWK